MQSKIQKPNHECRNCRKLYYACNDCERIHSWKTVCCSVECFSEYTEKIIRSRMKPKCAEDNSDVVEVTNPEVYTTEKLEINEEVK